MSLKVVVLCVRKLLSWTYSCVREGCCHVCIHVSEKIQSVTHWVNTVQETKFYSMVRFVVVLMCTCFLCMDMWIVCYMYTNYFQNELSGSEDEKEDGHNSDASEQQTSFKGFKNKR